MLHLIIVLSFSYVDKMPDWYSKFRSEGKSEDEIAELIDEGDQSIPIDIVEFMLGTMTLDQLHQLEDFITNHYGE